MFLIIRDKICYKDDLENEHQLRDITSKFEQSREDFHQALAEERLKVAKLEVMMNDVNGCVRILTVIMIMVIMI
jgi:hypothetical protein